MRAPSPGKKKKKTTTEPASLLQMNFSLRKCPDKLGGGKNLSDEKFLTPPSTGNLFHEVWPRVSLQPKLQKAEISKSGKINFWVKEWLEP